MLAISILTLVLASASSVPQQATAMCEALRDGQPLAARPIADAIAQFEGKRVARDKYDDAASIQAKVSEMIRETPSLGQPIAVSFAIKEYRIDYKPETRIVSFPAGAVDDGCPSFGIDQDDQPIDLLRHSVNTSPSLLDSPVCATEVLRKTPGQSFTGINSYGATTTVQVVDSTVAGLYVGLGAPASSPLFKGKSISSMRSAFTFELSPDKARRLAKDGEVVVVAVPRAPFIVSGKDATRPTMLTPVQERRSGSYLSAEITCSAIRDKASGQIYAYHDAVAPPQPVAAKPRNAPSIWLLGTTDVPKGAVFNLSVDERGSVSACTGEGVPPRIEKKACAMLMLRSRFTPALDAGGRPMQGSYRFENN